MKRPVLNMVLVLVWMVVLAGVLRGEEPAPTTQPASTQPAAAQKPATVKLQYRPPNRGAPEVRVSGGARGSDDPMPAVTVLAPPHVGLTVSAQPTLHWRLDKATDMTTLITIVREDTLNTVLKHQIAGPQAAGVHSLNLAAHDVILDAGVVYSWSVALVPAGETRPKSQHPFARAAVQRLAREDAITVAVENADPMQRLEVMADHGVWYDVITTLSTTAQDNPDSPVPLQARASLLEQVGLQDAARKDRAEAEDRMPTVSK